MFGGFLEQVVEAAILPIDQDRKVHLIVERCEKCGSAAVSEEQPAP
jgi:hypothetical protein